MNVNSDVVRLGHMLEAARKITAFVEGETRQALDTDKKLLLALRLVEIVGEAAARMNDTFKQENPQIPWTAIVGMRNRLIHAYFDVDRDVVWDN